MITYPYHLTKYATPYLLLQDSEYSDLLDIEIPFLFHRWIKQFHFPMLWLGRREELKVELMLRELPLLRAEIE